MRSEEASVGGMVHIPDDRSSENAGTRFAKLSRRR
jgi:hypothetical protein